MSRDQEERDQHDVNDETTPEAAQTDNPTGEDQAAANADDEPSG